MSDTPSVLFTTCSNTHPDDLIKLLLDTSELPEKIQVEGDIVGYSWCIDNKYYTAEVTLCSLPKLILGSQNFADTVQAIVLHFDSTQNNALDSVQCLLPVIEQYNPDVKILVTENVSNDSGLNKSCCRKDILNWCITNGFELVELEPEVEENDSGDVEDDFPETTGIQRIIQALNAHVWPNLVMKSNAGYGKGPNGSPGSFSQLRQKLGLDESLEELLDEDDDFSQLFSQLSVMKERMSGLSGNERKEAAEQVVKAFWKALGGDDNEF